MKTIRGLPCMQSNKHRQPPLHDQSSAAKKARADANFKTREERKVEAPKGMQEYREAEKSQKERMAILRAERLAREASDET